MKVVAVVNLFLLLVALFAVIAWVIPPAQECFVPPSAPTRGFYQSCWDYWEILT